MSTLSLRGGTLSPRSLQLTRTYRLLCSIEDSKSICPLSFPSLLFLWPVPHPPLANQNSAVEARQIAQQRAQITPRDQQTSLGKLSYQYQHQGTAFFFSRPELRLSGTPVTRPPPEPPPAAEEGTADSDPDAKTKTVPWTNAVSPPLTTHSPTPVVNQPGDTQDRTSLVSYPLAGARRPRRASNDIDHGPRHATKRPRCGPRINDLGVPDVTARTLAI